MAEIKLQTFLETFSADLDRTVDFWLKHSHDDEFGGFFTCLGKDGKIYDDVKFGWLQGRQVWMYAKLYNEVARFKRSDILEAAEKGAKFMLDHQREPQSKRCYFSTTREGEPIKFQRTIFTECFYVMGMSELSKATGNEPYKEEALSTMDKIVHWVREDDAELGLPKLSGNKPINTMAIPMMLLCVIDQLESMDSTLSSKYKELIDWCIPQVFAHIQREGSMILENVSLEGKELPGSRGRLTVPGHAIECGWFLLQFAQKRADSDLAEKVIKDLILTPLEYGWDKEHGGLFYFLDADGLSPAQLEWNMKLWWPHNEALIALLMAYKHTGHDIILHKFQQVFDYSYKHFVDKENGEWYGYLNQLGEVNNDFKGGAFKGCFHVPRCLLMCEQMLREMLHK